MSVRLHISNTDQFDDVGEGRRLDGEIWYRADLHEIHAFLNGHIRTLFDSDGRPANPPPTVRGSGTITIATSDSTSVQHVSLGYPASIVYVFASNDQDQTTFSDGWGDGITSVCTRSSIGLPSADMANTLNVQAVVVGAPAGWSATVLGNPDGFDVSWTKIGAGLNVTAKYLAIK